MSYLDWSIVAIYMLGILLLGILAGRKTSTFVDYFLAGRRLGVLVVTVSIIATETSAATFIGGPDTAYRSNAAYLQTTIGAVLSRFVLAYFFIDVYYRHQVITVYGYLAKRFGTVVQVVTAALFCVGRVGASGARLFIAGLAVAAIVGWGDEVGWTIAAIALFAIVYSVIGGLRAVVWTDSVQALLFVGIGAYSLCYIVSEVGGISLLLDSLTGTNKLILFDFDFNIFSAAFWMNPYTFLGAIVGGLTLGLATHGTDQDMVQRMLACRNSREGKRSLVFAAILEIPVALLFVGLGIALWSFYQQVPAPPENESVFPYFIATQFPVGLKGLLVAAILAAAMSSLDSALTALASVGLSDFYLPFLAWRRGKDIEVEQDVSLLSKSRAMSIVWGVLLMLAALLLASYHQANVAEALLGDDVGRQAELLTLALGIMALFYGPLLGVFITAIFTQRGSTTSVVGGLFAGLLVVLIVRTQELVVLGWTWHTLIGALTTILIAVVGKQKGDEI